jgi:hypothetical protein
MKVPIFFLTAAVLLSSAIGGTALAQRPSTDRHVAELGRYFDGVKIAAPIVEQRLAVYPVLVDDVPLLHGTWQTLDEAIARGTLVIGEKGGGTVPVVSVENRSQEAYILLMMGDVIKGGMQTRTVRYDTVLGPGQRLDLEVFCVEAHRWQGEKEFSAGETKVPQSVYNELRRSGASQAGVWKGVAGNNSSLGAENATGSLEKAIKSPAVEKKLEAVRKRVVPEIPRGTVGFIFVHGGRAVGAEFFGSEELARAEFPQLLDSYAVDYVILARPGRGERGSDDRAATDFFERVCRTGSQRVKTPGSGAGIRTQADGLLGDGVSLDSTLVHYGIQVERKVQPQPEVIWPREERHVPSPNDLPRRFR